MKIDTAYINRKGQKVKLRFDPYDIILLKDNKDGVMPALVVQSESSLDGLNLVCMLCWEIIISNMAYVDLRNTIVTEMRPMDVINRKDFLEEFEKKCGVNFNYDCMKPKQLYVWDSRNNCVIPTTKKEIEKIRGECHGNYN